MKALAPHENTEIVRAIANACEQGGLTNAFNPSLMSVTAGTLVVFRALRPDGQKPFGAYQLFISNDGRIESHAQQLYPAQTGEALADPKLFRRGEDIWVTFNTGTPASGENTIYVQRLWPTMGMAQRCILPERQRIEKNWGFLESPRDGVDAIYSLSPLYGLSVVAGAFDGCSELVLGKRPLGTGYKGRRSLTMGSQPVVTPRGYELICHEKFRIARRRAYVGRCVRITPGAEWKLEISQQALVHRLRDMLPQRRPHNPNLISATYFSGFQRVGENALTLGYGINDRTLSIATVDEAELW